MDKNYLNPEQFPLVLRMEDLMPILSIGRNSAYALVRSGAIRSVRIGRQLRIPRDALEEFLNGSREAEEISDSI